jgi:hypothetical protein
MTDVVITSGRLHCELVRILFLQAHRETFLLLQEFSFHKQITTRDMFRFRHATFYSQLKSKVGNILTKAEALRVRVATLT